MTTSQRRGYEKRKSFLVSNQFCARSSKETDQPLLVEIGFGMGHALVAYATDHPDWLCVGVDMYRPGIGAVVEHCERHDLSNVYIAETDAMTFLEEMALDRIDRLLVFFPDPWPKKRHWKRRLVTPQFTTVVVSRLRHNGELFVATDWGDYATVIEEVLGHAPNLQGGRIPRPEFRPQTAYEEKALAQGHSIWDFAYRKKN